MLLFNVSDVIVTVIYCGKGLPENRQITYIESFLSFPAQQFFAYEVIGLTCKQSIKLASQYIYELLSQECTSIFVLIKI